MFKNPTNKQRIKALEEEVQMLQEMLIQFMNVGSSSVRILEMEPAEVWLKRMRNTEQEYIRKAS